MSKINKELNVNYRTSSSIEKNNFNFENRAFFLVKVVKRSVLENS